MCYKSLSTTCSTLVLTTGALILSVTLTAVPCTTALAADWRSTLGFTLFGIIDESWTNPYTLVTIDPGTGDQIQVGSVGITKHSRSIDWDPKTNTLFGSETANTGIIQEIDLATGEANVVATIRDSGYPIQISSLAFAPDGTLYCVAPDFSLSLDRLGRCDLETETFMPLLAISSDAYAVAAIDISSSGMLYFVDRQSWSLGKIDLATLSLIDKKPIVGSYSVDDIDYAPDGFIYHTNYSYALMRIDPATAVQTHVGFGEVGDLAGIASTSENNVCTECDQNDDGTFTFRGDFKLWRDEGCMSSTKDLIDWVKACRSN